MHGRVDGKLCFVELVDVDVMLNSMCAGTTDNPIMGGVYRLAKSVCIMNEFSC